MAEPYEGRVRSRMADHLRACDQCSRDLPCPEWDQLYTASIDGSDPEESRARMWEHLHECDPCRLDQPCEEWDQLYAASEWDGASVPQRRIWLEEMGHRIRAGAVPLDEVAYGRDALQPGPAAVQVVTYKSAKDYERDAQRRVADGWTIQGQSQETGQTHRIRGATSGAVIGSLFMMPVAGAAVGGLSNKRTSGRITVTWVRAPSAGGSQALATPGAEDPDSTEALVRHLKSLADLRDSGVLTDEEFQVKKAELLSRT